MYITCILCVKPKLLWCWNLIQPCTCVCKSTEPRRSPDCTISQQMLGIVLWIIKETTLQMFCRFKTLNIKKIAILVRKLWRFLLNLCPYYSAVRHLGNCNLTWESPQIFTKRPQTPDKGIGTLCGKCGTQEVFDGFDIRGKIEGSQTRVSQFYLP